MYFKKEKGISMKMETLSDLSESLVRLNIYHNNLCHVMILDGYLGLKR